MEQNPCVQSVTDPSSQQFRQQLNQWFDQHGVLDNLRSHLRSIMISALQQTEFRLRPVQKTTPKIQSANLLIAEYLLKQGCHYTLSILMSELPALANFASGAILLHCGPKIGERDKLREKYRFEEVEVIEILNSLGVSSQDENLKLICDCYNRKKNEESLLECLLRFIARDEPNCKRLGGTPSGDVSPHMGDFVSRGVREIRSSPRQLLSMMPDGDLKRMVAEENDRRMRELIERERRIQDYLRMHEEEMLHRLKLAERELNIRRETIDRELTERHLHLGRIAYQLKAKHKEIMELSENYSAAKSENTSLRSKLDGVQVELNELRKELEKKCEIIQKLEAERMSMKCHVQEYLKWKNAGGTNGEVVTSNSHDVARRKIPEDRSSALGKKSTASLDSSSSSDESSGEESLLHKVKARVELIDGENTRINDKYLKYKKKYENQIEELIEEESLPKVPEIANEDCNWLVEVFEKSAEIDELEEVISRTCSEAVAEVGPTAVGVEEELLHFKKSTIEEQKRLIPTRRQQKNLEYFLRSRSLLEALEKSGAFPERQKKSPIVLQENSPASTSDLSLISSLSSKSEFQILSDKSKVPGLNLNSPREKESGLRDLTDLECLTLLNEAKRPLLKENIEAPAIKRDEGG